MLKSRDEHFPTLDAAEAEVASFIGPWDRHRTRPVCYLIHCDNERPDDAFVVEAQRWLGGGTIPEWAWNAHRADYAAFLGVADDLFLRFMQHCLDDVRGAPFTGLFPPRELAAVASCDEAWCRTGTADPSVERAEQRFRERYGLREESVFVYPEVDSGPGE